jgi:hypothetical protein
MRGKSLLLFVFILFLTSPSYPYGLTDLESESRTFLQMNDRAMHAAVPSDLANRRTRPILSSGTRPSWCIDLNAGNTIFPSFILDPEILDLQMFGGFRHCNDFHYSAINLIACTSFRPEWILSLRFGGLTFTSPMDYSHWKAGVGIGRRILYEKFYAVGLIIGLDYDISYGLMKEPIKSSAGAPGSRLDFEGNLVSDWLLHNVTIDLLLHKTFFLINFYSRLDATVSMGSSTSGLQGTITGGVPFQMSNKNTNPSYGIVLCAGFELILGQIKLAVEGGQNWVGKSLYASTGAVYEW